MDSLIKGELSAKVNLLVSKESHPEAAGSEFGVICLNAGDKYNIVTDKEYLFCLNTGSVVFHFNGEERKGCRKSCFNDDPYVLDVAAGTEVEIISEIDGTEINFASSDNPNSFEPLFIAPGELLFSGVVDENKLGGDTKRMKRVFYDATTHPKSALFCGEVVNFPGCWACFPPHLHKEPEIYYYKFNPSCGYGFSELGDGARKVTEHSVMCIPPELLHSQVTAPGYQGYIMWTQRLSVIGKNIEYRLDSTQAYLDK